MHADRRIKIMNEVLAGMRVIKMYAWEKGAMSIFSELHSPICSLLQGD